MKQCVICHFQENDGKMEMSTDLPSKCVTGDRRGGKEEEGERGKMKGEKMVGDRPLSVKTCTDTQEVKISEWKGRRMYDDEHICMCR